nr:hypothetical protein [Desulfobacula sp.]
MRTGKAGLHELAGALRPFTNIRKYGLLNTRFIHPQAYHDPHFLHQTLDRLEFLALDAGMTGLVFSDAYFLNALSRTGRDIISGLEAVPGVNCMMDSSRKVFAFFELIGHTGFKLPGKIALDRSLNRDPDRLEETVREIKARYPSIKIELLANEGCIDLCPFKLTHDAQISFSNLGLSRDQNYPTNRTLGCHAYFFKTPERFFSSPFIRPEDLNAYQHTADAVKLCGRTLGPKFLMNCITAYRDASHDGNLLSLMDAAHWLADLIHIDNKKLDPGFLSVLTSCSKNCGTCTLCRDLLLTASTHKPFTIKAYGDYL